MVLWDRSFTLLGAGCCRRLVAVFVVGLADGLGFAVELLEQAHAGAFLELEQDAYPGQVHAQVLGEVPDPEDPAEVILGVEPDVGGGAGRAHQALTLVDAQRPGMDAHQLRGHTDDVDRAAGVGAAGAPTRSC